MVEGAALEKRCTRKGTEGSNPSLSANVYYKNNMEFLKFEEQIFLSTTLIENLTDGEMGTGFFIIKPVSEKKNKILLFSNKHVFWGKKDQNNLNAEKNIRLTFHKKDTDGNFKLGETHSITGFLKRKGGGYFDHHNENVDVACANISNLANKGLNLNIMGLHINDFSDFVRSDIFAGTKVLFVGYPTGYYDKKHFLPIMRSGTIASIPSVNFEGKQQILLDAQVFPGSSGSPVFISLQNKYKLLGIVSDAVRKKLDFIELEATNHANIEKVSIPVEWIGLGLLFSIETIKEVYDLA